MIAAAEREVLYASAAATPTEAELAELGAAAERGVRVVLVGSAAEAGSTVSGVETVDRAPLWREARLSRLAVVDGEERLASAPMRDAEATYLAVLGDGHSVPTEYAVRGRGKTGGVLPVLTALLTDEP